MHGGVGKDRLQLEDTKALKAGCKNLAKHVQNIKKFGVPIVVALNRFTSDTKQERAVVKEYCLSIGVEIAECNHWAEGGEGATELAEKVVANSELQPRSFKPLYTDGQSLETKIETIAFEIYGASSLSLSSTARRKLDELEQLDFGKLPICMAKTPYSFSTDPKQKGVPTDHQVAVNDIRLNAGARFIVAICGEIMTMPGLPSQPAAHYIRVDEDGRVDGLF